ncbi:hypothetical protein FALCPG4_004186, partial [Fusarium falciforme]
MSYPFAKPPRHPSPRDRELPPIEKAVALIHAAKTDLDASAWICDLVPVEMFSDICLRVYFSENFSESDLIIANSGLLQLFLERSESTLEGKSENDSYTLMCRVNLESALVDLPLHLPATADMITALLLGAFHAIEISKPSLAWTLSSKAWELCQTLGYHQLSPSKYDTISDEMRPKQLLFWILYFIDKNLSLRLGRASNIQNWDITTPMLPLHGTRSPLGATVAMWINTARCRGDVYQSLYSPEALSQPNHVRQSRAEALSSELHEIERKSREVNDHYLQEARQRFGNRIVEFMTLCDDVLRLSLLTLIYRASPPPEESSSAFIPPCIEAARATLQRHQDFLSVFEDVNSLYFSTYVHWALLLAPFTPFIVLFCHVIECQDETDLNRLQAFITSMESTPTLSEAAAKMHRLFQVLYQVALRYLENFSSDSNGGQPQSNATLSAYLTTLGLPILNQDIHHQGSSALSSNTSPGVNSQQAMEGALDTLRGLDGQEGIHPTVWMGNRNGLE